ncbi:hypothetical protein HBH53_256720 [Parastagonospora nodorum]|nr:hypothetical protein HBH53_256720 [Parastagonospora nodorum]
MTDSPRARTLINLSAVLYEQSAARPSLPAEVSNIDLDFMPGVAFIPNVHIADSLRARTLINLSAVLYEQAAAQTSLPAEVGNIDLDFVPSVTFIPNVHIADSLRARTPINLSAVLPRARTLINLSAVLYEQADAQSGLSAEVGIIDLDFVPGVTFNAIGNVELTGDLPGNADRVNNNNNNVAPTPQFSPTALLNLRSLALKRPASSSSDLNRGRDDNDVQLVRDNIEELICVSKVKHTYVQAYTVPYPNSKKYLSNSSQQGRIKVLFCRARNNRNNLNIIVTNPTGREFSRAYNIGKFYKGKNIQLLRPVFKLQRYDYYNLQDSDSLTRIQAIDPTNVADVFNTVISKSDKVPTREPSSHIKTELLRDNSRKFYRLVITSEDTHCKQTIKKAYIMSPERASLILFMT